MEVGEGLSRVEENVKTSERLAKMESIYQHLATKDDIAELKAVNKWVIRLLIPTIVTAIGFLARYLLPLGGSGGTSSGG